MTKSMKWTDGLILAFSALLIGLSAWIMLRSGTFDFALYADQKLSWHLIRSSGIVAYVLLLASTVWGLFLSSQLVKNWSPGPISMTLHSTISWMALLLGLGHGLLLTADKFFTFSLSDVLLPFTGPYRPEVVGLGTLAFWILLVVAISFPLRKHIGHKWWKRLHYASYAAFVMVSAHGLFAGTDGVSAGFRILIGGGLVLTVLLLGVRLGRTNAKPEPRSARAASR